MLKDLIWKDVQIISKKHGPNITSNMDHLSEYKGEVEIVGYKNGEQFYYDKSGKEDKID